MNKPRTQKKPSYTQLEKENRSLKAYCLDNIKQKSDGSIPKAEFFSKYAEYCRNERLTIKTANRVSRDLPAIFSVTTERPKKDGQDGPARPWSWGGIDFKTEEEKKDEKEVETNVTSLNQFVGGKL